jgi:hypothetical protein
MGHPLRLLASNHLPLTAVGSNPDRDFRFFHMRKDIQLAYGTSVVLLRCPFVPEIIHGRAPEVSTSKAGTSPNDLYCVFET